jgi:hypothetical protein
MFQAVFGGVPPANDAPVNAPALAPVEIANRFNHVELLEQMQNLHLRKVGRPSTGFDTKLSSNGISAKNALIYALTDILKSTDNSVEVVTAQLDVLRKGYPVELIDELYTHLQEMRK